MDKWTICVALSSFAGSMLYGIWLMLSRLLRQEEYIYALQCSINIVVILFSVLALGGVGLCMFIDLRPENFSLPIYTNSIEGVLILFSYIWLFGLAWKIVQFVWQALQLKREAMTYFPCEASVNRIL